MYCCFCLDENRIMLDLIEKIDFQKQIESDVKEMIKNYYVAGSKKSEITVDDIDGYNFKPFIVGQERDGVILYSWTWDKSPFAKTFIAVFDQNSHKSKLVFVQDVIICVINASINADHSILGFSVVEKNTSAGYISPGDSGHIYKSYIAEIAPQNRLYSLDIAWSTYQGVQFLHAPQQGSHKISHMLFFHHKESIGLYHVPVVEVCDKGFVMSAFPSTQQIVRQFLWSQFDQMSQRLYYVVLFAQDEEEINATALLTVVEFKSDGDFEYVLNFPLPIAFKMNIMQKQAVYYDHYLSPFVCGYSLNLKVIAVRAGSFYVCYQHSIPETAVEEVENGEKTSHSSETSSTNSLSFGSESSEGPYVNYTICCVHGAYKLQCSTKYTSSIYKGAPRILFSLFNDYLLAYLPGSFLHLLDISCEHCPAHNILLRDDMTFLPNIKDWDRSTAPLLSCILQESVLSIQGSLIFENHTQKAYKFEFNPKLLFKLFLYSNAGTRLSALHASMVHFKDKLVIKRILERACQDPANMETLEILKEYLIAAAYMQMKRMVASPLDLKIFPFTSQEVYRGQVEVNEDGEPVVHLLYKMFSEDLIKQIQKVLYKKQIHILE